MKILNISNMSIWLWGEGKGIPSIFFPQREFVRKGYEVHFLCPLKEGEEKYSVMEGIHIYRFDFPFNFKKRVYMQTNNLIKKLKATSLYNLNWLFFQIFGFYYTIKLGFKIKPDIIYAHSPASAFLAYFASRIFSSKLIVRLYGIRGLYLQWHNFWIRIKNFREYLVFKLPASYFIITNDGTCGDLMAKKLNVPDEKIKCWRNGIDSEMFEIEKQAKQEICSLLNIPISSKIIASTSRLNYLYGTDNVSTAFLDLYKADKHIHCLFAGSGPDREKLEDFVRKNSLNANVHFLGIVDRKMVRKILNAADIFILLTRSHNCTNTMWEAMAAGKCIVTIKNELIKKILTSDENGILISLDHLDKLPNILEKLLNDETLRNKLGEKARMRAREVLEPWAKRIEKEAILLEGLVKK